MNNELNNDFSNSSSPGGFEPQNPIKTDYNGMNNTISNGVVNNGSQGLTETYNANMMGLNGIDSNANATSYGNETLDNSMYNQSIGYNTINNSLDGSSYMSSVAGTQVNSNNMGYSGEIVMDTSVVSDVNNNVMQPSSIASETMYNPMPVDNGMINNMTVPPISDNGPKGKKKWVVPVLLLVIVLVVLLGGVGYKVIMSSPKVIFENSINNVFKEINRNVDEFYRIEDIFDIENKAVTLSGEIKTDIKLEELEELGFNINDYSFGAELGFDLKNDLMQGSAYLKGESEKVEAKLYVQDDYIYMGSNLFEGYLEQEYPEMTSMFEEIKETYKQYKEESTSEEEDYDYVSDAIKNALINSLDSSKMGKENSSIEVNGKELKATKYSYVLDEEALKETLNTVVDTLLGDEEFLKRAARLAGEEKETIEKYLNEMKTSIDKLQLEKELVVNVYTNGLFNKTTGFSLEYDDKEFFHYYTDGENFEAVCSDVDNGKELARIVSVKTDGVSEIKVTYEGEKVATITIREYSEKVIDLDVLIYLDSQPIKGTIYLSSDIEETKVSGEYKFRVEFDDQYLGVEGSYGIESSEKLEKATIDKVISEDEIDQEEVLRNLEEIANKDEAFKKLYDMINESLESQNLNEYDMKNITTLEEVDKVLESTEGTVLYVGTSRSAIKDSNETALLGKLRNFQYSYNFNSYYYDYIVLPEEFTNLVTEAPIKCLNGSASDEPTNCLNGETNCVPTCLEYPTIYFIKNGEIVLGLRGNIDDASIFSALKDIGIVSVYSGNEI